MKTLNNPVFVWVSDIHINSKQALSLPEIDLGEGDKYYANALQRALYTAWRETWKEVKTKAKGRPIVVGVGGEVIDIDFKKRSNQFITKDAESARSHGMELMQPVIDIASKIIMIRGTEAHVGNNGAQDEAIAKDIDKQRKGLVHKNKETGDFSWHYFRGFIGGRKFDLAHHVSMGTAQRTERNAANQLSADLIMQYARWKEAIPDFAFRGHVHRVSDSSINFPIRSVIGGCWQMATPFIHRIGGGATKPEIGVIYCDIAKNEVEYLEYDYKREAPEHI